MIKDQIIQGWVNLVCRHPGFRHSLITAYGSIAKGGGWEEAKASFIEDTGAEPDIAGAVSFFGRKMKADEDWPCVDEMSLRVDHVIHSHIRAKTRMQAMAGKKPDRSYTAQPYYKSFRQFGDD